MLQTGLDGAQTIFLDNKKNKIFKMYYPNSLVIHILKY